MVKVLRPHSKSLFFLILSIIVISSCGGGSSNKMEPLNISIAGLKTNSLGYEKQEISISSNYPECLYQITQNEDLDVDKLLHVSSYDSKTFSFRNPIVYSDDLVINFTVSSIPSSLCPEGAASQQINVSKYPTAYDLTPQNINSLSTSSFQVNDIGFGGIIITDRFSATICYPTPNDCVTYQNELFGQDAHNMTYGDFNGDGFEDFVVAWAVFPHTIEQEQKIMAPINIYLNNGDGRFAEDLSIYETGEAPRIPFAYRTLAADFNGDGIDDIFSGSMGVQYRDEDYSENYINYYPHLLMLSNPSGKFVNASQNIEHLNNEKGQCGFAHEASYGDPDGDGDLDIYACNILNINDGEGNFKIHEHINMSWSNDAINQFGSPMSSLLVDLNNDSFDDIVFWNFDNREHWSDADEGYILLSNGTKNIQNWEQVTLPQGPFGYNHNKYNHAAFGDLNNDGFNDVVVAITRDLPYYEGAYVQVLINDGNGRLIDETEKRFLEQARADSHHGEGNIYLRDMNQDGFLDIIHSTRDYFTEFHGAHIALNDGIGNFNSIPNSVLPKRPDRGFNNHHQLMKGLPINADNEACLDLISVTDAGFRDGSKETNNFLFTIINKECNY